MGESLAQFFNYIGQHPAAISNFVAMIGALAIIVLGAMQWLFWMKRWGRFAQPPAAQQPGSGVSSNQAPVARLLTNFFTTIISEFRHLLALLIFLLFAFILSYAVYVASHGQGRTPADLIDDMSKVIQAVVASLGGLVGSIIGYYFGESSARSAKKDSAIEAATAATTTGIQEAPQTGTEAVRQATPPPPPGTAPQGGGETQPGGAPSGTVP